MDLDSLAGIRSIVPNYYFHDVQLLKNHQADQAVHVRKFPNIQDPTAIHGKSQIASADLAGLTKVFSATTTLVNQWKMLHPATVRHFEKKEGLLVWVNSSGCPVFLPY